jgi:NACalpha-BTF3-like transcription factor
MESPEVKRQKLVSQLIAVANKIHEEQRQGKADHVIVPEKNIELIAKKFNISIEEAQQVLKEYFESELNK